MLYMIVKRGNATDLSWSAFGVYPWSLDPSPIPSILLAHWSPYTLVDHTIFKLDQAENKTRGTLISDSRNWEHDPYRAVVSFVSVYSGGYCAGSSQFQWWKPMVQARWRDMWEWRKKRWWLWEMKKVTIIKNLHW